MTHQRIADGWNVVVLRLPVLDQDRLTQQIAHADPEGAGHLADHVQAANVALVALNLAQPILGAADKLSQNALGQTPTPAVERRSPTLK
jgi:hypothetical protein